MNAKNTPAPWQFGTYHTTGLSLGDECHRVFLPANAAVWVTGENQEANARLIAAAHDLKAALGNALRSMEYAAMALEAPEKCALRENIEQAKEALKKAGIEQ